MAEVKPFLSVVVTSCNQLPLLQQLLPQLAEQDFPVVDREIIVVDDASSDGSREWLSSQQPLIALVGNERNLGRARARNLGVQHARGRVLVMIDGDHSIGPGFLSAHAVRHQTESCALVGRSTYAHHPGFEAIHHYLNGCGAEKVPPGSSLPGRYFLARNCSMPRALFLSLGGLDERFTAWGGEDLDLGMRIVASGIRILFEPTASAVHHHLRPLDEVLSQLFEYGRSGIPLLLSKHPQLFVELNLDHLTQAPGMPNRFGALHRSLYRLLMSAPIYEMARRVVVGRGRHRLPRALLDYLHLRQYGRGYLSAQQEAAATTEYSVESLGSRSSPGPR